MNIQRIARLRMPRRLTLEALPGLIAGAAQ
jgi:hypothetical protein